MNAVKKQLILKKKSDYSLDYLNDKDLNDIRKSLLVIKSAPNGLIELLNIDKDVLNILAEDLKFILGI